MHVVQVSFFVDSARRPGRELLRAWRSLADIAVLARRGGMRVTVIQAAAAHERLEHEGVDFRFVQHERAAAPLAARNDVRALFTSLSPDVVHVHGLGFPREVLALRGAQPKTPMLLQDHADRAPRLFWRRPGWRRGLAAADAIAFCALEQAKLLGDAMRLPPKTRVFEVPESTSRFAPGDRAAARAATGIDGDPCLLWVGHLAPNKDPLTVLDGVSRAAREMPGLRLWCCFGTAPMRAQVERRIAGDPMLSSRVTLLGEVPHEMVERLMQAADLFVLGSHREGSGYSVIEALATGLPPVVTDIPSFRSLVGRGDAAGGELWPCGDADALAAALVRCARRPELRAAARRRFASEVSFDAVGRKLAAVYRELVSP
jgi:glycosyltransferase involved in cell wall biosynthesis